MRGESSPDEGSHGDGPGGDGPSEGPSFPTLWCHGAGGAALTRIELDGAFGDARSREELAAALTTVVREGFGYNFSLCHGDLGNLDVLMLAGGAGEAAGEQAARTLDGLDERGWVCGLPGPPLPSLMTGVAGIGYGLLRLAAPESVPSVLAMRPHARA